MASAQWKNFQPSTQENTMLPYQRSSSFSKSSSSHNNANNCSSSPTHNTGVIREAGIIEKLLPSYGFIQCCEKQARLFFHFSQFCGNIEHLKVGDAVEFETSYDHKTGKPVARSIMKIASEALSDDVLIDEKVSGVVTTEIKNGNEGRIAYENRGECFFLPYSSDDVQGNDVRLVPGDKVAFHILTDKDTGNPRASDICLEKTMHQGVVCTLKETYGFIERADVVREIFFHASECKEFKNMSLGDDVEFDIQNRNNKEVATNVSRLPLGTVVFEDVSSEVINGQIIKALDRYQNRQNGDPLPGRIRYRRENKENEIQFGEKDTRGEYVLQVGDWVQFNLAVDRRDKLQKATNIELLADESFLVSCEKREQGIVAAVKDGYGFIRCSDRDSRLYFRFTEILDGNASVKVQDEVEFTVAQDPSSPSRSHASRIKILPHGSVSLGGGHFERRLVGVVNKEAAGLWPKGSKGAGPPSNGDTETESEGTIVYQSNGEEKALPFTLHDYESRCPPKVGDKVEFSISQEVGGRKVAVEVKLAVHHSGGRNGFRYTHRGFVAALKESYGFIETEEHDREIFFHFSVYDGNVQNLELGQEVVYGILNKSGKVSAECVKKLPNGTIPSEEAQSEVYNGLIVRPVRCFNPEQEEYSGLVVVSQEGVENNQQKYPFGITSLYDKHDFLQKGDPVQFQLGQTKDGRERAVNIKAMRVQLQSTVEAIKSNFGFLSHEVEEGKKLFFHMSEVKDGVGLQPGDRVEFVLMHNLRTGKHSACNIVKIGDGQPSQRPERLVSRLRTLSVDDSGPKIIVLRQPRGPDGTKGFKLLRCGGEAMGFCEIGAPDMHPCYDNIDEEHAPISVAT